MKPKRQFQSRQHLALIKLQIPRTESDCEREAFTFLRSWTRARARLARRNNAETTDDCAMPVRGASNVVERQLGPAAPGATIADHQGAQSRG